MDEFKKGDKVTWKSHGGEAVGKVKKKITSDTEAAGRHGAGVEGRSAVPGGERQERRRGRPQAIGAQEGLTAPVTS